MRHHCVAFTASVDSAGAFTRLNALNGSADIVNVNNDHTFKKDWWLYGAAGMGATISRVRFQQPHWNYPRFPEVYPLNLAAIPPTDPNVYDLRGGYELDIRAYEPLECDVIELAAGAERETVVVFLADQRPSMSDFSVGGGIGPTFITRATSATAVTANAWSLIALTFDENPPAGIYRVLGFVHQSTNGQAARLILPGDVNYRPGSLSVTAITNRTHNMFLEDPRDLGLWDTVALPQLEVLANGADAAHVVLFKFQKIGDLFAQAA